MAVVEAVESTSKSIHGHGPDGAACRYLWRVSVDNMRKVRGQNLRWCGYRRWHGYITILEVLKSDVRVVMAHSEGGGQCSSHDVLADGTSSCRNCREEGGC